MDSGLIKRIKNIRFRKSTLIYIIIIELVLLFTFAVILTQLVSFNAGSPAPHADLPFTDEISCSEGQLNVSNVSVRVPAGKSTKYKISYAWGKDDKKYPTVPRSVTASYYSKTHKQLYDISLYRKSFTPSREIPKGKNASNWFDDWDSVDEPYSKQEPKTAGEIHGFMITSPGSPDAGTHTAVCEDSSFYFAIKTKDGISVYVIEGLLYNRDAQDTFSKALESAISSINTNHAS